MRPRTVGWCVLLTALAVSIPAWAHVDTLSTPMVSIALGVETLTAASPSMDGLWTLVSAIAVATVLIARRRRAVAVAGIMLLLLVAFEAGVHSVHHLGDKPDGQCVVASASVHTGGVTVEQITFERPAETTAAVAVMPPASPALRPAAPDLGRAPPTA
jgi:hypothetical protein